MASLQLPLSLQISHSHRPPHSQLLRLPPSSWVNEKQSNSYLFHPPNWSTSQCLHSFYKATVPLLPSKAITSTWALAPLLPSQGQFLQGQSHQHVKHFHISLLIKRKNSPSYILLQPTPVSSAFLHVKTFRASLVAQWLRICLPMQGTRVRALVWEDPTCRRAAGPVSHNYWACASGAHAPQQEKPR